MSDCVVAALHVAKCKKKSKLEATSSKVLNKLAKAKKDEKIKCRITAEKVAFRGKKEVILRSRVEDSKRNAKEKIVVIIAKGEKKEETDIYGVKFADEENFERFYNIINGNPEKSNDEKAPSYSPQEPEDLPEARYENLPLPSDQSDAHQGSRDDDSPIEAISMESQDASINKPKSRQSRKNKSGSESDSDKSDLNRQSHVNKREPSRKDESEIIATYISTDKLNPPKRDSGATRRPLNKSSRTEVTYYKYVPGKGMVKRVRSASETSSSSSSSSTSSNSTSSTDTPSHSNVFRLERVNSAHKGNKSGHRNNQKRSVSPTSSSSSSSSSTVRNTPESEVNVWKYRDFNDDDDTSSYSSDKSDDSSHVPETGPRRSRSQRNTIYVECPSCQRRSMSRKRAY